MRTELVTTLKRKASNIIDDINKDREPVLITQHGLPSAYLVDTKTFEGLLHRIQVLEGIAVGEKAIAEGNHVTHAEAKRELGKWFKSSGRARR